MSQTDRLVILVAGLSASGHYTEEEVNALWDEQLKRRDNGKEWKEAGEVCRYIPAVVEDAINLLRVINRVEDSGVSL